MGLNASFDMYFLDYRGVGRSVPSLGSRGCLTAVGIDSAGCAAAAVTDWGDSLHAFSVTNIARDVQLAMRSEASSSKATKAGVTAVFAVSFGTYVANRMLQLDSGAGIDLVVLDGVCTPGYCAGLNMDAHLDMVGTYFMDRYASTSQEVATRLPDPIESMAQVFADARQAAGCAAKSGYNTTQLAGATATLLTPYMYPFIPALIHRATRCNDDDVVAIKHFFRLQAAATLSGAPELPAGDSQVHMLNIEYSELWHGKPVPSAEDVTALYDHRYQFQNPVLNTRNELAGYAAWPKYQIDPTLVSFGRGNFPAKVEPEVHVFNGDLDTAAPHFNTLELVRNYKLVGADVQMHTIPYSQHTTVGQSPTKSGLPCGAQQILNVISGRPAGAGGCLRDLVQPDFAGSANQTRELSMRLFGTLSMWG